MNRPLLIAASVLLSLFGCTDASVYSVKGKGANLPDRVTFEGHFCIPSPSGRNFPTRILFAAQGGTTLDVDSRSSVVDAITATAGHYTGPFVKFGLETFDDYAFNLLKGGFGDNTALGLALPHYSTFAEPGPLSYLRALELAETLVSGVLIEDCAGARARGRYTVVLLVFEADQGEADCSNLPTTDDCYNPKPDCRTCLLKQETLRIRALAQKYNAAEVTVQPIYVPLGNPDINAREHVATIASVGGTKELETTLGPTASNPLKNALMGLNLGGLDEELTLRTAIAFNRFARARGGVLLPDSDGDGLPDEDEDKLGTDPTNPDTDGDLLLDGVEVVAGLDPLTPDVINGCDLGMDADHDGLNSCEERLLGTSDCMGDTDGDGAPDLIELFAGTDPLKPEGTLDADSDGYDNLDELRRHTDPTSNDAEFLGSHSYAYEWTLETPPQADSDAAASDPCPGRNRYKVTFSNVGLVHTLETPSHPAGLNDIYLYVVFGLPTGGSIARWQSQKIIYEPPATRTPPDPVIFLDENETENRP